jgi:general secretion pathway protein B
VPAARMLIVDGQVLREGDEAAPGLKLEKIQPAGAIFNQRGQRFELPLP